MTTMNFREVLNIGLEAGLDKNEIISLYITGLNDGNIEPLDYDTTIKLFIVLMLTEAVLKQAQKNEEY